MGELTAELIKKAIGDSWADNDDADGDENEGFSWHELAWQNEGHKFEVKVGGEPVEFEIVVADGGGEGHGEHCEIVFKHGEQFFEKTGFYASHYGTDWDGDLTEVRPVEKTITVFEPVS